ncbi:MAG: tyrosine-type recombinase/integrase [Mycobacterium sp.]|uniref:tyrosine-type recombinase/integrase n=1 Tax=Mycobacterium sp. TaxID=1785 RepID=UPI003F99D507
MPKRLLDLADLLDSWLRYLRGQRRSEQTQRAYRRAVEAYLAYCAGIGVPAELTKARVTDWLATQQDCQTATVRLRLAAVKRFAAWLAAEEGFDADPILIIRPPKLAQAAVADLSDNEVARLLKVCEGTALRDKRDKAMLALLCETGLRASELLALDMSDIDLDGCLLQVRHGKGGKARRVRFSATTAALVDRYLRARRNALRRPSEGPLWISSQARRLSYTGLVSTLKARAADAGVVGFHVHRLRHTAAVRWMRSGGSETGLRAHGGWSDNSMIYRYTKTASEQLAAEEFDRLGLGVHEL